MRTPGSWDQRSEKKGEKMTRRVARVIAEFSQVSQDQPMKESKAPRVTGAFHSPWFLFPTLQKARLNMVLSFSWKGMAGWHQLPRDGRRHPCPRGSIPGKALSSRSWGSQHADLLASPFLLFSNHTSHKFWCISLRPEPRSGTLGSQDSLSALLCFFL